MVSMVISTRLWQSGARWSFWATPVPPTFITKHFKIFPNYFSHVPFYWKLGQYFIFAQSHSFNEYLVSTYQVPGPRLVLRIPGKTWSLSFRSFGSNRWACIYKQWRRENYFRGSGRSLSRQTYSSQWDTKERPILVGQEDSAKEKGKDLQKISYLGWSWIFSL